MKLIFNENSEWVGETKAGTFHLPQLTKLVRLKEGHKTAGGCEIALGINHPRIAHLENGRSNNIGTFLEMAYELGYEIEVRKKA